MKIPIFALSLALVATPALTFSQAMQPDQPSSTPHTALKKGDKVYPCPRLDAALEGVSVPCYNLTVNAEAQDKMPSLLKLQKINNLIARVAIMWTDKNKNRDVEANDLLEQINGTWRKLCEEQPSNPCDTTEPPKKKSWWRR